MNPVYSIAPHAKFLTTLADRVIDGTLLGGWDNSGPFGLSDVTIVLPTRRARLTLAEIFAERGVGLLPDIRTFGGEDKEEEPFLPPIDVSILPAPVSLVERRLVLSRLVSLWAVSDDGRQALASPPNAAEVLKLAESLGGLIDDLAAEGCTPQQLDAIVPADLATNWQQTLKFLQIVFRAWPEILGERQKADKSVLRNERLLRQAMAAPLVYGDKPVIAAGSTGSIPATAALLKAIAALPHGAVVLPGVDTTLSAAAHETLLDPISNSHGHPQYGLAKLLRTLGQTMGNVIELADADHARTVLVRHALALSPDTAYWAQNRLAPNQLTAAGKGLTLLSARTEDEEARAIALAARDGLVRGKSVGIVTPDQNLARRIAAELGRFDIRVDDAAGAPLFHAPAGRLLRQILALATRNFAPVDLMAILRNRACVLGTSRAEISPVADLVEMGVLRGQRPNPGVTGLRALLTANVDETTKYPVRRLTSADAAAIEILLTRLEQAMAPLMTALSQAHLTAGGFVDALLAANERIANADIGGAAELALWGREVRAQGAEGITFEPVGLDGVLQALMQGFEVRNVMARRDDIAIWGQLEARLQNPDLLIIAALNEDIWPEAADPGPWLSRQMRLAAGLEPPERKAGLAAHDFAMALGNGEIIVAFSERLGTSPAIASRLVQRLEAFAGEATGTLWRQRGEKWLAEARALDATAAPRAASMPVPNPPPSIRPRRLSITEIETLFRSPYDLYAKHVLNLKPMDPLGEEAGGRERGSIIHDIFGRFVEEGNDVMAANALATLNELAQDGFSGLDAIGERRDIWMRRFTTAAQLFLDFERGRNHLVCQRHAERSGKWDLQLSQPFTLSGRADRIDEMLDGTLEIIDFKTGTPPGPGEMKRFEAPQLLLEAAMAHVGAFADIAAADTSNLSYIKIGLGPDAFIEKPFALDDGFDLMGAADEAAIRMQRHVAEFLFNQRPMIPRLFPLSNQRYAGAYDHLARTAEWSLTAGEDSA
ncbi:double-strand break repair protein AddB [Devosia algicola]|uniref:Double-strand break repair protein AddB n=1 Tax=Devosia algicola TaxID=3026418 RepID=A0ABY7YMC8_9HYPH|nr:double-strand break repair protein AddB [Devosia algicola]WDR02100.1 double-strand break repair protein AddB [Devosia algicola]